MIHGAAVMTDAVPEGHSKHGASSADRWWPDHCPGSVRLSEGMPDHKSEYAAEGTVAHGIAEEALRSGLNVERFIGEVRVVDGYRIKVDEEMTDAVAEYVTTVRQDIKPGDVYGFEVKFHLKQLHEDLWGTSDAVVYSPAAYLLRVYDYKHGAGKRVEVVDNPQLKYYGLGAALSERFGGAVKEVELVIVQPRCDHPEGAVRRWRIPAVDLIDFSADLLHAVWTTERNDASIRPGEWCQWCPAAGKPCPALLAQSQQLAAVEFSPPTNYDPEALAHALDLADQLDAGIKQMRAFAKAEAEAGRCPPGWALKPKRAQRKWGGGEKAILGALEGYVTTEERKALYTEPALKSPAQVEKVLGKKLTTELLGALIKKESSGANLVRDADGTGAHSKAELEFSPV